MTSAEARLNKSLRPRKPEGSLGRTAQDVHLDSHTAPELCDFFWVLSHATLWDSADPPAPQKQQQQQQQNRKEKKVWHNLQAVFIAQWNLRWLPNPKKKKKKTVYSQTTTNVFPKVQLSSHCDSCCS